MRLGGKSKKFKSLAQVFNFSGQLNRFAMLLKYEKIILWF